MPDPELHTLEDALKEEKCHWQSQQPFMIFFILVHQNSPNLEILDT